MTREIRTELERVFGITKEEWALDRVTHDRFQEIMMSRRTKVHRVEEGENSYGEFLFVRMSRRTRQGPCVATFWGLGYHEHRDIYITDEWHFHESYLPPQGEMDKARVNRLIASRRQMIKDEARHHTQSPEGELFSYVADLTDDDGALADLQDGFLSMLGREE